MSDTRNNNILMGLYQGLQHINNYTFFQYVDDSTLGYSTITYKNSHFRGKEQTVLNLKEISVNMDKKAIINDPLLRNQLYSQNLSFIEDILGKPFSFNDISYDLLLSLYFDSKEDDDKKTKKVEYKYFNNSLNIIQNSDTDFVEISVNEKFKKSQEFYLNFPKLKTEDHLIEIYFSTKDIVILPDSTNNTIIFRFKRDIENLEFVFRVSKFTSTNLLNVIKHRTVEKPHIYLKNKKTSFFLEKDEVCSLKARFYKKVQLCNSAEMSLALQNNNDFKKENFLYINSSVSDDQIIMDLLLNLADVSSPTYHILCHLREYNNKKSNLNFLKECDWIYYKDIYRIIEIISTQFMLNRSMWKIKKETPLFLNEIKLILENKKFVGENSEYIPTRVLQFLEEKDLFLSSEDRLLYIRLVYLRNMIFDPTPGPEKRLHNHFNLLDKNYIPYVIMELKSSTKSDKNLQSVKGNMEYVKVLAQLIDNYFKMLTNNPFVFLINYLNNLENPYGYKFLNIFKTGIKEPQVNKGKNAEEPVIVVEDEPETKKHFYQKPFFIGVCITGAVITVIGGAIYTLI